MGKATLINVVDKDIRNNIMHLEQKLRGFGAEIESKIYYASLPDSTESEADKQRLLSMDQEVKKALNNIALIVQLAIPDGVDPASFREEKQQELASFFDSMLANMDIIEKMRSQF